MSGRRAAVWLLAALGGAAPAVAQPCAVASCLDGGAAPRATALLRQRLPDLDFEVRQWAGRDLVEALRGGDAGVDVVLGLDSLLAVPLAHARVLAIAAPPAGAGLPLRYRGPDDRFLVPLLSPIGIAVDVATWPPSNRPRDFDDLLFEPQYFEKYAVCEPGAQPSLWVGWIRRQLQVGHAEEMAFQWLRTVDARVQGYEPSVGAVRRALLERRVSLAVLPVAAIHGVVGYDVVVPPPVPVTGLAMARVEGGAPAAAAVLDVLVSAEFAGAMAEARLVPAPRRDAPGVAVPAAVDELRAALAPYDHTGSDTVRWLAQWRDTVRGQGRRYVWLERTLEVVFALGFAVFLIVLYRRQSAEGQAK